MKKLLSLLLLSGALAACNDTDGDGNKDINIHIDLDSTGNKIERKLNEIGDSTAAKTKRLEKKIDKKFNNSGL
jgi:predicted small secreted protein